MLGESYSCYEFKFFYGVFCVLLSFLLFPAALIPRNSSRIAWSGLLSLFSRSLSLHLSSKPVQSNPPHSLSLLIKWLSLGLGYLTPFAKQGQRKPVEAGKYCFRIECIQIQPTLLQKLSLLSETIPTLSKFPGLAVKT